MKLNYYFACSHIHTIQINIHLCAPQFHPKIRSLFYVPFYLLSKVYSSAQIANNETIHFKPSQMGSRQTSKLAKLWKTRGKFDGRNRKGSQAFVQSSKLHPCIKLMVIECYEGRGGGAELSLPCTLIIFNTCPLSLPHNTVITLFEHRFLIDKACDGWHSLTVFRI